MFKIRLKTLTGNEVGKKQTFTGFFKIKFGAGTKDSHLACTFITPEGITRDTVRIYYIKSARSKCDLVIKSVVNILFLMDKIIEKYKIKPDFITLISPELSAEYSRSWILFKETIGLSQGTESKSLEELIDICNKCYVDIEAVNKLKYYRDKYPLTKFLTIDPNRDKEKYKKSLQIYSKLEEQLERQLLNYIA
jgi:hypothetical protein